MATQSIYHYQDPQQFVLDSFNNLQKNDPSFSVRKWSKEMELKGHSLLVMLMQGKRNIRVQHSEFLAKGLSLSSEEKVYLSTLIQYKNAKTLEEKKHIALFLQELHPGQDFNSTEVSAFIAISDWVYMAILAMTELKDFKGSEEEIVTRLNGKISISEVRSALIRLLDLKLIKWREDGKLMATYNRVTTSDDVSNEGAKEYHRQVLDLAKLAIDEQDISEREFQSFSMAISQAKIPLAKEMIRKFRKKLSHAVSGDGDYVYQTNIQFFQLTKNPTHLSEVRSVAMDSTINQEKK